MPRGELVAGVDFGTDSVRVSVWDLAARREIVTVSSEFRRWAAGQYCVPEDHQFRQHPLDHLEALEACFAQIADLLGDGAITAIAVDSTGSTPGPTDARGVPLALLPEHADDPDCMFWLWKDHTSSAEAAAVDRALRSGDHDFSSFQGTYSSEWWWAKILRGVTHSEAIAADAVSWVEHSDWIANLLVGRDDVAEFSRNSCGAGHKALYNRSLGGMVPRSVLMSLHPHLADVADTFRTPPDPAGTRLGTVTAEWAERLRLHADTIVGVGSLDAHAGGVGAGIEPGTLVKVIGTSTVDLFLTDYGSLAGKDIRAICGIAEDSVVPGHLGGETGQAAFGDLLAWYARLLTWVDDGVLRRALADALPPDVLDAALAAARDAVLPKLEQAALEREPSGIVALDWLNGRRYPQMDDHATAALLGLRIGHDAVDIYRALVLSAVFGSRAIFDGLREIADIQRVVLVGGVARKSSLVCQAIADAFDMDVMVVQDDEACAKGAAMFAAVASGHFATIPEAQRALCRPCAADYHPRPEGVAELDRAYRDYLLAGYGTRSRDDVRA